MKRILSVFLIASLLAVPCAAVQAVPTAVSYEALPALIAQHSPAVAEVLHSYEALSLELASLQKRHNELMNSDAPLSAVAPLAIPIQDAMKELKTALSRRERDLNNASQGQLYAARTLFITHSLCAEDIVMANLALESAREDLRVGAARLQAGMLAKNELSRLERAVRVQSDAVADLEKAQSANLTVLADLLGISAPIAPEGLPEANFEAITQRDPDADLAGYTLSAPAVREKKALLDQAKDVRDNSGTAANRYAYTVAQENYEQAKLLAARDFPTVHQNLLDAYHRYDASESVRQAGEDLRAAQRQCELGLAPRTSVLAAERALAAAESAHRKESLSLRLALLEYEYNLIA